MLWKQTTERCGLVLEVQGQAARRLMEAGRTASGEAFGETIACGYLARTPGKDFEDRKLKV